MAAGLGFKTFTAGEVLTAGDTNGYLMQGILVFASAAARDSAITSPQEGQACYLKDTNEVLTYSGSAWVAVGGASGGMTLLSTTSLSGTSTTVSSISQSFTDLVVIVNNPYVNTADTLRIDPNSTNSISLWSGTFNNSAYTDATMYSVHNLLTTSTPVNSIGIIINQYSNTSFGKPFRFSGSLNGTATTGVRTVNYGGTVVTTSEITALKFTTSGGSATFSGGQVLIYGVK
jgi:hypothetical protein